MNNLNDTSYAFREYFILLKNRIFTVFRHAITALKVSNTHKKIPPAQDILEQSK